MMKTDVDEESSISASISVAAGAKKRKSKRMKESENIEKLCQKIDDFVSIKEKEKLDMSVNTEEKLKKYEKEIENLKTQIVKNEESYRQHQYEENIRNLNTIIENQSRTISELNTDITKMKGSLEVAALKEKNLSLEKNVQDTSATADKKTSPTLDFLDALKDKMNDLEREEKLVDDDWEELSISNDKLTAATDSQ